MLAAVGQLDDFLADLHGQLARGHQDQGLRVPFVLALRRTVPESEWRRRPSCRCRCGPGPARRCRPGRGGSSRLESGSAEDIRPSPAQRASPRKGQGPRNWRPRAIWAGAALTSDSDTSEREVFGYPRARGSANETVFDGLTLAGDQGLVNGERIPAVWYRMAVINHALLEERAMKPSQSNFWRRVSSRAMCPEFMRPRCSDRHQGRRGDRPVPHCGHLLWIGARSPPRGSSCKELGVVTCDVP